MSSAGRSGKRKKKGTWNQKPKGKGKSSGGNRGLPGKFIQQYGDAVERQMITKQVWNEFYKSPEGKKRATDIMARYFEDNAARQIAINDQGVSVPVRDDKAIATVVRTNAINKAAARTRGK